MQRTELETTQKKIDLIDKRMERLVNKGAQDTELYKKLENKLDELCEKLL